MLLAFILGAAVGCGELLSKYRDSPRALPAIFSVYLYAGINGLAAVIAYVVIKGLDWNFGLEAQDDLLDWVRILVAGTLAMAALRSSLARVRIGSTDVSLGLQLLLDAVLNATDRAVDRARAERRDKVISEVMDGLEFDLVRTSLPPYCFHLLQNSSADDEASIGSAARALAEDDQIPDLIKTRMLGLQLMTIVGPAVLRKAVEGLRPHLKSTSAAVAQGAEPSTTKEPLVPRATGLGEPGGVEDERALMGGS